MDKTLTMKLYSEINQFGLPVGEPISELTIAEVPKRQIYTGEFVELSPTDPERDVDGLFLSSHGSPEKLAIWTYLPMAGPFSNREKMLDWLRLCEAHSQYTFFSVRDAATGDCVGMLSYVSVEPNMRTIEIGFVWYHPRVQRSKVNTECIYLLLKEAFTTMRYRRVEWKCDALNERSRAAALRLGFSFEGIFRKHKIVHGRNRDTAWYAMTEQEWPEVKANMETWLYSEQYDVSLSELNRGIVEKYSTCREV